MVFCVSCGHKLAGRYCGQCGGDSQSTADAQLRRRVGLKNGTVSKLSGVRREFQWNHCKSSSILGGTCSTRMVTLLHVSRRRGWTQAALQCTLTPSWYHGGRSKRPRGVVTAPFRPSACLWCVINYSLIMHLCTRETH